MKSTAAIVMLVFSLVVNAAAVARQLAHEAHGNKVLLTNGNIIEGVIEQRPGEIVVHTSGGSRIVLPKDRVDLICVSLDDALEQKRDRIRFAESESSEGERPIARIELFYWCLKHGMLDEAQVELNSIQLSKIPARELDNLLRQLHSAYSRRDLAGTHSGIAPNSGGVPTCDVASKFEITELPSPNGVGNDLGTTIRPASFEEDSSAGSQTNSLPSWELDRLTKLIPVECASQYKRRIEPLIFRSCSSAGCHDPGKTRMPLLRYSRGETITRRMSQQNLLCVLRFVGTGDEQSSPLLHAATTAHGGATEPALKPESEQYRMLAAWVAQAAGPAASIGIEQSDSSNLPKGIPPSSDYPPPDARRLPSPASGDVPTNDSSIADAIPNIPSLDEQTSTFVPADPFDPEIFNRKYLKR